MDQQAAERAKQAATSAAATSPVRGEEMTTSFADEATHSAGTTTPVTAVTEIKQEPLLPPVSPTTDEGSIMQTLDKNKETLKRKLMMRRSLIELVDQGIYPPPKTPPAFMEQRKSLERAKIGDSLRFKISHRPDRQQLVQQHILEDTNIHPSLHERQRLLKKARLTDSLNDKLSHRPGILELVQGNILQTDDNLHQLIKEGSLSFDKSSELSHMLPYNEDSKSSDEAFSPDQTDDSNLSDISSPPIPQAPELPTSFAKSLPFSAQIQFSEESKVTLPSSTSPAFTIPQQITTIGTFPMSGGSVVSGSVVSSRNNVTVTTINSNNNNKARPKKPKPKPQPKAKVIKFHEYKGPPNIVKSTPPVCSSPAAAAAAVHVSNPVQAGPQAINPDNTPYHILLQQQQLYLQWQLEFGQKNRSTVQTVLLPAQKDLGSSLAQVAPSSSSSVTSSPLSPADSAALTTTTHASPQTVFTVTPSNQHGQPQTPMQQIRMASPGIQIQQEAQVGQPQPQLNPNITPIPNKQVVKKPQQTVASGPPKQYTSLEEMKVAELKAELKKRNLPVSGPKPQLLERLKPYADSIIKNYNVKSPSSSISSPGSSATSVLSPPSSAKTSSSPLSFSVTSPQSSVMSPQGVVMNSKGFVISPSGVSSGSMTVPVSIVTSSAMFSPPGSVQSSVGSLSSPGSVHSLSNVSVTSPTVTMQRPNSVLSRQGSVMSPLGSVIDETLMANAVSPLPSIQSMQSAVSVSNMNLMPDDLSNPFSPPQSPLFIDSVMTPLSPDLMEIPVPSPQDQNSGSSSKNQNYSSSSQSNVEVHNHPPNTMEQSRPPSVLSLAPSDMERMEVDLDLTQSINSGINMSDSLISQSGTQPVPPPPPPPLPQTLTKVSLANQTREVQVQQHLLQQIQFQLQKLQERQHQQQQKEQAQQMSTQISQEELLRQQQEKIEKLQTQLEESQLRLQLQQLQHQQLQQQQQQLHQLQQQQQLQQQLHKQTAQQQQQQHDQALKQQLQEQQRQQQKAQEQELQRQHQEHQEHLRQQQEQQEHLRQQQEQQENLRQQQEQQRQHEQAQQEHEQKQAQKHEQQQQAQQQAKLQQQHQQLQQQQQHRSPQTVIPTSSYQQQPVSKNLTTVLPMAVPAQSIPGQNNASQPQQNMTTSPSVMAQQVPNSSAQSAPLVFNLPNGTKAPMLANLPPNMKQIQIPAHLLHGLQNQQGLQTVIVTQNPKVNAAKGKTAHAEFLKNQTLDLGGGKSLIAVTNAQTGAQQFIITATPNQPKPGTSSSNMNGLKEPPAQKTATSLPTSPVNSLPQQPVSRTSSNPFYIPMKEPPKYDDVVKQKQKKSPGESSTVGGLKSQTMDDVLEILIRSGELPESAAQEPPPTPKTSTPTSTVTTVSESKVTASPGTIQSPSNMDNFHCQNSPANSHSSPNLANFNIQCSPGNTQPTPNFGNFNIHSSPGNSHSSPDLVNYKIENSTGTSHSPSSMGNQSGMPMGTGYPTVMTTMSVTSVSDSNKNVIYYPMEQPNTLPYNLDCVKTEIKSEAPSPQPCCILTTTAPPGTSNVNDNSNMDDLFDLNEVINSDFTSMDWTSDTGFGDLDLTDTSQLHSGMDLMPNDNAFLTIPTSHSAHRSNHGSEPDLANLGLGDMDTNSNMQIDVPDWLDVIMPSTGLTPLSVSAPVSFPSDPILTPTTQQEVLDLFSLEESDLNTPSDLNNGSNMASHWDKLLGTTSS